MFLRCFSRKTREKQNERNRESKGLLFLVLFCLTPLFCSTGCSTIGTETCSLQLHSDGEAQCTVLLAPLFFTGARETESIESSVLFFVFFCHLLYMFFVVDVCFRFVVLLFFCAVCSAVCVCVFFVLSFYCFFLNS